MKEAIVKVEGMTCRSCVGRIEGALDQIGVEGQVNFDEGNVKVTFNDAEVQLADIEDVIRSKGYQVAN